MMILILVTMPLMNTTVSATDFHGANDDRSNDDNNKIDDINDDTHVGNDDSNDCMDDNNIMN